MRHRRVGAGLHQRVKRECSAQLADQGAEHQRDLDLRLAGAQARESRVARRVGNRRGASELFDLGLVLDQTQAHDLGADVDQLADTGARRDHLGREQAEVILFDADLGQAGERAVDQLVWIFAVAPCHHSGIRRMLGRRLTLQRGHDQCRAVVPHGERHQALVRVGVKAGEVGDRNRPGDVNRFEMAIRHPAADLIERSPGRDRPIQCR